MKRRGFATVLVLSLVAFSFACSKASSPTSPSLNSAGATINGSVVGATPGIALSGLHVSIVGTGLKSTVDGSNHFSFLNVPEGSVQLQFSGPGVNATLGLGDVHGSPTMSVKVKLDSSSATLESEAADSPGEQEIHGAIVAVPPTTAAGSFTVGSETILTDVNTKITQGSTVKTFADLKVGLHVEVHGAAATGGTLATRVEIEDEPPAPAAPPQGGVELEGAISGLTGNASAFSFVVNGTTVHGDGTTVFHSSFADLVNGAKVEVKGTQQTGFVLATDIHVEAADSDGKGGDDQDGDGDHHGGSSSTSAEAKGAVGSLTGSCPSIQFVINSQTIFTDSSTSFEGGCSTLKAGSHVEVKGTKQSDGRIKASKIEKD